MNKKILGVTSILIASAFSLFACNNKSSLPSNSQITSISASTSVSTSTSISASTSIDDKSLLDYKNISYSKLDYAFNELDVDDYSDLSWKQIVDSFTKAKNDINNATSKESIDNITNNCISFIKTVKTRRELLSNTPFQFSSGNYNLDIDPNNNEIIIGYKNWPGNWAYVGNTTYTHEDVVDLKHDINTQNVYKMSVRNNGKNKMYVQLKMTNEDDSYTNSTDIVILKSGEETELTLSLTQKVTYMYLFVNSCYVDKYYPIIEGEGELRISSYGFDYVKQDAPIYDKNKVEVVPNKSVAIGTEYIYSLREIKNISEIDKVRITCRIDMSGTSSTTYYGGTIKVGNTAISISGNGYIHEYDTNKDKIKDYCIQTFVLETKDLTESSFLSILFSYAGNGVTGTTIQNITFYYKTGKSFIDETVITKDYPNSTIFDTTYHELVIPYSAFKNKGRVEKITVNLTVSNNQSYTGGTMFCTGCGDFMDSNLANFGFMQKANEVTTGDVILYPTVDFDLTDEEKQFTFTSWWAAASSVVVNSVTITSEVITAPTTPNGLVAHASNGGVALEWEATEGATKYGVYVNGTQVTTVSTPYCYIDELTNEQEYSFQIVAINSVGSSKLTNVVKATPSASIEYDLTIDGLNSDLEKMIGKSQLQTMMKTSIVSKGNNYRFKNAIEKMKSGKDTTIGFIGGSITVGEICNKKTEEGFQKGYAAYTYDYIKDTFGTGKNVRYLNAGISGTGSEIGIVRVDEDIISKSPDIIFVEYACNNGITDFDKESYESLLRKCLNAPNKPAVVSLFSATTYSGGKVEEYMTQIGNYYNIPMLSMDKALKTICATNNNGQLITSDKIFKAFIKDGTHPNDEGHQLYGKMLANLIRIISKDNKDLEYVVPTNSYLTNGNKYETLQMINSKSATTVIKSVGSWESSDTETQCLRESHTTAFDSGWSKTTVDENNAFVMETYSKNAILIYKNENPEISGNYGKINIVVTDIDSGEIIKTITQDLTISYRDGKSTGWHNPVAINLYDFEVCGNYRVTINMDNSQNGTGSIFAIGYSN